MDAREIKRIKKGLKVAPQPNDVLTLDQACDYLQLSRVTTRRLALDGTLPAQKCGSQWRFLKSALDDFLRAQHEPKAESEVEQR
jgi:excisionase family DNA binding protein